MKNVDLAIKLSKAETEESVIEILSNEGYWNDYSYWRPLGDISNNYSIIGNQQDKPDSAFVEKIINSIDACLTCESLKRNIDPSGPDAPKSTEEALQQFYGIKKGGLMLLDSKRKSELAKNIVVAATGQTKGGQINLCIADRGEGQTPKRMPDTILSISKSNKLNNPFVQGKFNQGGTGALPFCGNHRLQLVISKRCPDIANTEADETYSKWSITIVRRESAREGRKSSMYTYLTDKHGDLLTFEADSLPIVPMESIKGVKGFKYEELEYGTFIKLYNYQLTGYKSIITRDLYDRLSLLIPDLALPVRMRDSRGFNGNTNAANLAGLVSRLYDNRSDVLEDGFPSSSSFVVDGQRINCSIYLFKKDTEDKYRGKREGVLFTLNGQTQGVLPDSFFNRVNLSYIQKSILVLVDCTEIDSDHQEELFMTSRDRMRSGDFYKQIEHRIEQELRDHSGLKKAANERRAASLKDKIADDKPLRNVLQDICKKSQVLSRLFIAGKEISAPFNNSKTAGTSQKFKGKKHPTYFELMGKFKDGKLVKDVSCNSSFRVQFTTDVENDYFHRPLDSGRLVLMMDGHERNDLIQHLSLFDGVATLTVALPQRSADGDKHEFATEIIDDCIVNSFESMFYVNVTAAEDTRPGGSTSRHKPIDAKKKGNEHRPEGFAMPNIRSVRKDDWAEYDMDNFSALVYRSTDSGGDYFINMDNDYLLTELKSKNRKSASDLTEARYTYSMALIGMSIISYYKKGSHDADVESEVRRITSIIAPILIPMLESMAALEIDEMLTAA